MILKPLKDWGCYQSQNYKIWKQFTTSFNHNIYNVPLLSITKSQNLKAIHNPLPQQTYKGLVVINHKTTKFESNSQLRIGIEGVLGSCYQSQNYKIWKQFTTVRITNIIASWVVINHKTTKFESNSQLRSVGCGKYICCYQSQNLKAIHNQNYK